VFHDIRRAENGFQINPNLLHIAPLVGEVKRVLQPLFPIFDLLFENLGKRRTFHSLGLDRLVIQQLLDFLDRSAGHSKRACFAPRLQGSLHYFPLFELFGHDLFYGVFARGIFADNFDLFQITI